MARLVTLFRNLSTKSSSSKGLRNRSLGKILATIAVLCILTFSTVAFAQSRRGTHALEPLPPRPKQAVRPWPWFIAFILLGLAWYPAFKNSKRELTE